MRGHNNGGRQPNQRPSNSGIYNGEWLPQNSMETGQAQSYNTGGAEFPSQYGHYGLYDQSGHQETGSSQEFWYPGLDMIDVDGFQYQSSETSTSLPSTIHDTSNSTSSTAPAVMYGNGIGASNPWDNQRVQQWMRDAINNPESTRVIQPQPQSGATLHHTAFHSSVATYLPQASYPTPNSTPDTSFNVSNVPAVDNYSYPTYFDDTSRASGLFGDPSSSLEGFTNVNEQALQSFHPSLGSWSTSEYNPPSVQTNFDFDPLFQRRAVDLPIRMPPYQTQSNLLSVNQPELSTDNGSSAQRPTIRSQPVSAYLRGQASNPLPIASTWPGYDYHHLARDRALDPQVLVPPYQIPSHFPVNNTHFAVGTSSSSSAQVSEERNPPLPARRGRPPKRTSDSKPKPHDKTPYDRPRMAPTGTKKAKKSKSKPAPEIDITLRERPVPPSPTISVRKVPNQYRLNAQGNKPSGDRHIRGGLGPTIDERIVVDGPSGATSEPFKKSRREYFEGGHDRWYRCRWNGCRKEVLATTIAMREHMKIHMKEPQEFVKELVSVKGKGKAESDDEETDDEPIWEGPTQERPTEAESSDQKPTENESVEKQVEVIKLLCKWHPPLRVRLPGSADPLFITFHPLSYQCRKAIMATSVVNHVGTHLDEEQQPSALNARCGCNKVAVRRGQHYTNCPKNTQVTGVAMQTEGGSNVEGEKKKKKKSGKRRGRKKKKKE